MMLRLGELAIAQSNPEALRHIEAQPCSPMERWKREREATGFDEGQIGAEIARRWDFPEVVSRLWHSILFLQKVNVVMLSLFQHMQGNF
jgi:HD-like signal output (HDOD) protein